MQFVLLIEDCNPRKKFSGIKVVWRDENPISWKHSLTICWSNQELFMNWNKKCEILFRCSSWFFWEKLAVKSEFLKYHKCAHNAGVYNNITHETGVYGRGVQISQHFVSHLKRWVINSNFILRNSNNRRHYTKFSRHGNLVPKICVHVVYWIEHCARIITIYVAFRLEDTSIQHCVFILQPLHRSQPETCEHPGQVNNFSPRQAYKLAPLKPTFCKFSAYERAGKNLRAELKFQIMFREILSHV